AATLDTLLDKVSAAIRSEQRLTSELAHELRTPLTAVQGTADLALLDEGLSPEARETMEEVAAAARRMATTITTLLEVARTEAGTRDAASSSLADVVEEVLRTVAHERVDVVVSVADQRVAAPPAILARALTPLVENAVRIARTQVVVSSPDTAAGSGDVRLLVEDDGPGIEDPTDDVFLPGTSSSGGSGAGLGLAIARRMARSVGGEVTLARPQGPTRFELRLPRA
ncbi:sensor histidine kinase, partial [Nocardioides sp. P5_C9_2]